MDTIFLQNIGTHRWSMSFRGQRVVTYRDMICDYTPKTKPDYHIDFVGPMVTDLVTDIYHEFKLKYLSVQSIGKYDSVLCLLSAPFKVEPIRSKLTLILSHGFADWRLIHGTDNITPRSIGTNELG